MNIKRSDIIRALSARYSFDKSMQSKVMNPSKYGIRLTDEAIAYLQECFPTSREALQSAFSSASAKRGTNETVTAERSTVATRNRGHIEAECRREAHASVDVNNRYKEILSVWQGSMTARQIANALGYSDMNAVRPRICELSKAGVLVATGKVKDMETGKNVTAWRLVTII